MRVRFVTREPNRTRRPTVSPTCSPSVAAMRAAAARAASLRGSSTRIFLSFAHASSSRTSGTRVVLPAPGGATSTAALRSASAVVSAGSATSIGRVVSNCRATAIASPPARTGGPLAQTWGELRNEGALACPPLRRGTATSIEWPGCPHSLVPCPSDALVSKTAAGHFVRSVHVSKIDENRLRHNRLEAVEIKRAELLPFGDNHQRGGTFGAGVGVIAKRDVPDQTLGLLHAYRIVSAHFGAHVLQCRNERNRWRLAHIVRIWLECQ